MAQSSSSSSSSKFDVFLSFRGEDTRKTFTDHLYQALYQRGISTFIDEESLERGHRIQERIWNAIENSVICITILSRSYGDSRWCLMELAKMVQYGDKVIIPIFYHVDPSEVRHQSGPFGEAFARLQARFNEETVAEWRRALVEVSAFSGFDIRNAANGHEAKLILEIVERVQRELNYSEFNSTTNTDVYSPGVMALSNQVNRLSNEMMIRMAEQIKSGGLLAINHCMLGLKSTQQQPIRQVQSQRLIQETQEEHSALGRVQPMQIHGQIPLKQGAEEAFSQIHADGASWNSCSSTPTPPYSGVLDSFQALLKGHTTLLNSVPGSSNANFRDANGNGRRPDAQDRLPEQGATQNPQVSSSTGDDTSYMGQGVEGRHKLEREMQWDNIMGLAGQMKSGSSNGSTNNMALTVQATTDQLNHMRTLNFVHMLENFRNCEESVTKIVDNYIGRIS